MRRALTAAFLAGAACLAQPVHAQPQHCNRYDMRVEEAFKFARNGDVQSSIAELRRLSFEPEPELLLDIAKRALEGFPRSGPLLAPNYELAVNTLEKALAFEGPHVAQTMYLLSVVSAETGAYTPDRRAELRELSAAFGYELALVEMARELTVNAIEIGPGGNYERLRLFLTSVDRTSSPMMMLFALELMERAETKDLLPVDRETLVGEILQLYRQAYRDGRLSAAGALSKIYMEGKLVEQDLGRARDWLTRTAECWRGPEYRLMGRLAALSDAPEQAKEADFYRMSANWGNVPGALDLVQMYTRDRSDQVTVEEATLWLRRATQLGDLRAAIIWVSAVEADATFPAYDTKTLSLMMATAEGTWAGDGATARRLAQLYSFQEAPWHSVEKAEEWYKSAALTGDATGMLEHGRSLLAGNPLQARDWIMRAQAAGSTPALVDMADILMTPPVTKGDAAEAIRFLQRAVEKGSLTALSRLSKIYLEDGSAFYDLDAGKKMLEQAAERGSASAQTRLAEILLEEALVAIPSEAALLRDRAGRYLVQAAGKGNLAAKHLIGNLILLETTDPEEVARAVDYLTQAANGGRVSAMIDLAEYHISIADLTQAVEIYRRAADLGSVRAVLELARAYSAGLGVERSEVESLFWLSRAEELGETDARTLRQLAAGFISGEFGPADIDKGLSYYLRAAQLGDAASMMQMATIYNDGLLVEPNPVTAFDWALKSAEAGNVSAMVFVGEAYNEGLGTGQDPAAALGWMKQALQSNPNNATAALAIGRAYESGTGFDKDLVQALEYYERAAQLGNISAMIRAARSYQRGIGIRPTPERSIAWYDRAARTGSITATLELAQLHAMGFGTPLDSERAFELYLDAANNGSTIGMRESARLLVAGIGTARDAERGIALLERAARLGDLGAMRDLWILYDEGFETPANASYAMSWLKRAAEGGHAQAGYEYARAVYEDTGFMSDDLRAMLRHAAKNEVEEAAIWLAELKQAESQPVEDSIAE